MCLLIDLNTETGGFNLFTDVFQIAELTQIMRQKDRVFAELLSRLRTHQKDVLLSAEDRALLKSCERDIQSDAIHIFPTNVQVEKHNNAQLQRLCSDLICIEAKGEGLLILKPSAELAAHRLIREIGDVPDHTGNGESHVRALSTIIVSLVPVRVSHDRLPGYFIKSDGQG